MARRYVTSIKKDQNGDIIALYNPETMWSPIGRETAILEIESGLNKYFMHVSGIGDVNFTVSKEGQKKILLTDLKNAPNKQLIDR